MHRAQDHVPPSATVELALEALRGQGCYGAMSQLAEVYGVSRQTVHSVRDRAVAAVEEALGEEGRCGGRWTIEVGEEDMARAVVALRVLTPATIRGIEDALPALLGRHWSYGKIHSALETAGARAAAWLEQVDLSDVQAVALDEMFSQGEPVLGGIDLDTQYLFLLGRRECRTGEEWATSLAPLRDKQGLAPATVVKDAGSGLAKGVALAFPEAEARDDLFHAVYLMGQTARRLEQQAYALIGREEELTHRRLEARREKVRRRLGQELRYLHPQLDERIERYDRFEVLRREAERVLRLADRGSGRLHTSAEVAAALCRIAEAMEALGGPGVHKTATYLRERAPGLARYLDDLNQRLDAVAPDVGGPRVVEATVRAYQASLDAGRAVPCWERRAVGDELTAATQDLLTIHAAQPDDLQRALSLVLPLLHQRHRASSAIENLNSVLRPYLTVQKSAPEAFLRLFCYYWNTRARRWGRGKGTSPYEALTGRRIEDWLTELGYPPSRAATLQAA